MDVSSIEDVMRDMERLDRELPGSDFSNVKAFNHTYLIITHGVYRQLGTGFFEHEDVMRRVDVTFFDYYVSPMGKYQKKKKIPQAWKLLFDFAKKDNSFQFLYMALGVNAHVNNDLAQTLYDADVPLSFKKDYDKVNGIIADSFRDVVKALPEKSGIVRFVQNGSFDLYGFFLNKVIMQWREHAWKNFLKLKEGEITVADIEREATVMAQKLLDIKSPYEIHKLRHFM